MSIIQSRRDFLKNAGKLAFGACVASVVPMSAVAEETAVSHPYPYVELDPAVAEQIAYEGYFQNGCCYGVAKGLLAELSAKVGYPYTIISPDIFANGKEGYTCGTLCGALGGAVGVIGMCCSPDDARKVTKELIAWYTSTPLPIYQPEGECPAQSISPSANCFDSVTTFKETAKVEHADPIRKRRCGGVSGDVARKTVELLNIHFGFAQPQPEAAAEETLAANEYIGEGQGFGGPIKVKVTMNGDQIAKIDVLSHSETAGISAPAFDNVPNAIIAAQSTEVDIATGATFTSKGLIEAVNNALAQVK
ncbi:MAG: FMN-binding protein [Clostridia bacterium]|nr:FMN-binding protein [Clostridia bacterium]